MICIIYICTIKVTYQRYVTNKDSSNTVDDSINRKIKFKHKANG
nr:MAG TPA: hypothetical protein [Caudoviricetes sp.]